MIRMKFDTSEMSFLRGHITFIDNLSSSLFICLKTFKILLFSDFDPNFWVQFFTQFYMEIPNIGERNFFDDIKKKYQLLHSQRNLGAQLVPGDQLLNQMPDGSTHLVRFFLPWS